MPVSAIFPSHWSGLLPDTPTGPKKWRRSIRLLCHQSSTATDNNRPDYCFLATLRRNVPRRGFINNLYSDNATNFTGTNAELIRLHQLSWDDAILTAAVIKGIRRHCIPSRSLHFGGLWEVSVKSPKHHLQRITGNALLTYEELQTLLCQIEAILNSSLFIRFPITLLTI